MSGPALTDSSTLGAGVAGPINKAMDRADLLTPEGRKTVAELNALVRLLYGRGVAPSSWVGTLRPPMRPTLIERLLRRAPRPGPKEVGPLDVGMEQRLAYEPLPGAADDLRLPWFLYWEIHWVMSVTRGLLRPGARLFDGGGASSLFTCYLASQGFEVHSVDLNQKLRDNGERVAKAMGWNSKAYAMDMAKMDFPDGWFDHAYSICVFEHLDYDVKQAALREIARCLKPGGVLSLTFDWRNPAPGVVGYGKDTRERNQLKTEEDIRRNFLSTGLFELAGNQEFAENGKSYLVHPRFDDAPYSFGAVFLRKR